MENEKKHHFNIVDAIIIVIILVILSFCAYKAISYYDSKINNNIQSNLNNFNGDKYTCKIIVNNISSEFTNAFNVNDKVYNQSSTLLGNIKEVVVSDCEETFISPIDGSSKQVLVPEKINVLLTMELITSPDNIYVGKKLNFKTEYISATGTILTRDLVTAGE